MSETVDDQSTASQVRAEQPPVVVVVACGTEPRCEVIPLRGELALGRTAAHDDDRMSREHATVRLERGAWIVARPRQPQRHVRRR